MPSLKEVYTAVAQQADTEKQQIGVSDVTRVLSQFFAVLSTYDPADINDIIAKGLRKVK